MISLVALSRFALTTSGVYEAEIMLEHQLLGEQNKFDRVPLSLFYRLQRVLPWEDWTADKVVHEEIKEIIPQMFEVMQRVAKYSCKYVRNAHLGGKSPFLDLHVLMITARTVGGTIEEVDRDLAKVIEDFSRATSIEALRLSKAIGELFFLTMVHSQLIRTNTDEELLLARLEVVETNYRRDLACMHGTREALLDNLNRWATKESGQKESDIYWIYGPPGIGKTSLAHSICRRLDDENHLAGAFFCQRDGRSLSDPRYVLPTLILKLTKIFPPFRHLVAKHLRNDPHLSAELMNPSLFPDLIRSLTRHPKRPLVFVIDALDECGDASSRPPIMRALTDAGAAAPWLKIIVTSRPEADILRSFDALFEWSHQRYDLNMDQNARSDLQIFAQAQFREVAILWNLPMPWPSSWLLDLAILRSEGKFLFIRTMALGLLDCDDPTKHLKMILDVSPGLTDLDTFYLRIVEARIKHSTAEFRQMIGVLLIAAQHRPLSDEAIAGLAGVRLSLVKEWIKELGSLLYRDEGANGGIRTRHLSISEFFFSDRCPSDYRVDQQDANVHLGFACLQTMITQLCFNICKLKDSRLANAEVKDLPLLIKDNISDALQYSSMYWSNHLCGAKDNDRRVLESLWAFFEGPHALYWIEILSIMGMVPIGVPNLRRVISTLVKVSTPPQ